jgi:amidohydrolase
MYRVSKVLSLAMLLSGLCAAHEAPRTSVSAPLLPIEGLIQKQADEIFEEIVKIRRAIHSHPEPSGEEVRTAKLVADRLRFWGLEVRTGVGGHGVIGILQGKSPSPVVAYRADMDAERQDLAEQVTFKSTVPGVAHVCGHDAHTAIGLGIARVLSSVRDRLPGTVVFIFQPSEENGQGARHMIADGALEKPEPSAIFALHIAPFDVGTLTTTPGTGLPGMELLEVRMKGGKDLSAAAEELAAFLRSANTIGQLEFGRIIGAIFEKDSKLLSSFVGTNARVTKSPDGVVVTGRIRAANELEHSRVKTSFLAKAKELEARGITCKHDVVLSIPALKGDPNLGVWAMGPLEGMLGKTSVLRVYHPFPFNSEDFAFFLQKVPGVLFWLGGSDTPRGVIAVPHTPDFSLDERALATGVKGMSNVLFQYLATQGK